MALRILSLIMDIKDYQKIEELIENKTSPICKKIDKVILLLQGNGVDQPGVVDMVRVNSISTKIILGIEGEPGLKDLVRDHDIWIDRIKKIGAGMFVLIGGQIAIMFFCWLKSILK
jgi:hypothetical protein